MSLCRPDFQNGSTSRSLLVVRSILWILTNILKREKIRVHKDKYYFIKSCVLYTYKIGIYILGHFIKSIYCSGCSQNQIAVESHYVNHTFHPRFSDTLENILARLLCAYSRTVGPLRFPLSLPHWFEFIFIESFFFSLMIMCQNISSALFNCFEKCLRKIIFTP